MNSNIYKTPLTQVSAGHALKGHEGREMGVVKFIKRKVLIYTALYRVGELLFLHGKTAHHAESQ